MGSHRVDTTEHLNRSSSIYTLTHTCVCESTYRLIRALWIKAVIWSFMERRKERRERGRWREEGREEKGRRRKERKKERKEKKDS